MDFKEYVRVIDRDTSEVRLFLTEASARMYSKNNPTKRFKIEY